MSKRQVTVKQLVDALKELYEMHLNPADQAKGHEIIEMSLQNKQK